MNKKNFISSSISRDSIFEQLINIFSKKILKILVNTNITPNQVTFFGGIVGILGMILSFFISNKILISLSLLFYLIADFLDGDLARHKELFSNKGALLDKYIDKLILILLLIYLYFFNIENSENYKSLKFILIFAIMYFQTLLVLNSSLRLSLTEIKTLDHRSKLKKLKNLFNIYLRPTHTNIIVYFIIANFMNQLDIYIYCLGTLSLVFILKQFYNLKNL